MNRKYTKKEYLAKINKIKEARPNINLTTDVIVGFPNETEEDFNECIAFCKQVGFSKIHVFPYSVREGTKAASMEGQIPNNIKKQRARKLIEIDKQLQKEYNSKFLNTPIDVLIEENISDKSIGHTENFLKVIINQKLEINKIYKVIITDITSDYVIAILK